MLARTHPLATLYIDAAQVHIDTAQALAVGRGVQDLNELLVAHISVQDRAEEGRVGASDNDFAVGHGQKRSTFGHGPVIAVVPVNPVCTFIPPGELEAILILELERQVVIEEVGQPKVTRERLLEDGQDFIVRLCM